MSLTTSHPELLAACFYRTQLQRRQLKFWKGSVSALRMFRAVLSISNTRRLTPHQGRGLKPYTARGFLQDVNCILPLVIQTQEVLAERNLQMDVKPREKQPKWAPPGREPLLCVSYLLNPGGISSDHLHQMSATVRDSLVLQTHGNSPSSLNPLFSQHVLQLY